MASDLHFSADLDLPVTIIQNFLAECYDISRIIPIFASC